MSKPVKISQIVDAMDEQSEGTRFFFDRQTGRVERVSDDDDLSDDPTDAAADWEREQIEIVRLIDADEQDRFVPLPDSFDIHEWSLMERFAQSEADERVAGALLEALHGGGAFGRFKRKVNELGVADRWYAFRDAAYRDIAADWCAGNDITVEPEDAAG